MYVCIHDVHPADALVGTYHKLNVHVCGLDQSVGALSHRIYIYIESTHSLASLSLFLMILSRVANCGQQQRQEVGTRNLRLVDAYIHTH